LRMRIRGHRARSSIGVALQGTPSLFSSCVVFWVFTAARGKREREEQCLSKWHCSVFIYLFILFMGYPKIYYNKEHTHTWNQVET
jgi:cbb3-type cytochrome oxidase subunit 3